MTHPSMASPPSQPQSVAAPTSRVRRGVWKVVLCLLTVFVGGGIVGAITTLRVLDHEIARRADPARWTTLLMERLDGRLHLTPDQRRNLEPLVRSGVNDIQQVRAQAFTEAAGIVQRTREQVQPALTGDQRQRLDQFLDERARIAHRWLGVGPAAAASSPPPKTR